jgi:hypothetical protein
MAHNVPAVYDVFASPIKETAGFPGLAKMWVELSEGGEAYTERYAPFILNIVVNIV